METMHYLPDQLFPNLDKFPGLKELSARINGTQDMLSVLPEEFPNLHHMERLIIQTSTESDLSKLGKDGAWISSSRVRWKSHLASSC